VKKLLDESELEANVKILEETPRSALSQRISKHYDVASPLYQELWGMHVHHGLWRSGKESLTKEQASDELVNELVQRAGLRKKKGCKVLDVGCGVGGTSIKLSTEMSIAAKVTGITISSKQVELATANAAAADAKGLYKASGAPLPRFLLMNGEKISFPGEDGTFDCVWICEALSHFEDKPAFFKHAYRMLAPRGKLVVADWFKADFVTKPSELETLRAIEYGMLLPSLDTKHAYSAMMQQAGFELNYLEDVSAEVAATWDISASLILNMSLWKLALVEGADFVSFLRSFKAMRAGFRDRIFRYGLFVAEKP